MFCPRCGSPKWDFLFGGNCRFECLNCHKGIVCNDMPFSREVKKDSIPTWNPLKAVLLRIKYNIKGNN